MGRAVQLPQVQEIGVGDDRRRAFADAAMGDQPVGADLDRPREANPGDAVSTSWPAEPPRHRPSLFRRIEPQPPMREQPGVGEHRRRPERSPSGRWLGHSSIGSASSSTLPRPGTHSSSATRSSAVCAGGWAISSNCPLASSAGSVDADRNHPIMLLELGERVGAAAFERELLAEHQRQAGQQKQCRTIARTLREPGGSIGRS